MLPFSLALGASAAWGAADFLAGLASRRIALILVLLVSQAAGLALILPLVLASGDPLPAGQFVLLGALSGVFNAAALAAFYRGLTLGRMGVVAPIAATDAVIPLAFGVITGERPAPVESLGLGLALVGVVLASRASPDEADEGPRGPLGKGVGLALLAAVCFGFFVVALDGASEGGALWAVVFSRLTTVGLLGAALLGAVAPRPSARLFITNKGTELRLLLRKPADRPELRLREGDGLRLSAIGGLDVSANALFAVSTTAGLLSQVGVLGSLYPVITVLLARLVLRERLDALQRVGSAGALLGVALIGAG